MTDRPGRTRQPERRGTSVVLRALCGLVLTGLAAAPPLGAGTIRLETTVDCTVGIEVARCGVEIAASGDETPTNLRVSAELAGVVRAVGSVSRLSPGESWRGEIELPLADLPPGRAALFVEVAYEDAEGYPLSALSHTALEIGPRRPLPPIRGGLAAARLTRSPSTVILTLTNESQRPVRGSLRLVLPQELTGSAPAGSVELAAETTTTLEIELANRFAFAGGSYRYYALFEADDAAGRLALAVPGIAAISTPPPPTERLLWPLVAAALAAGLLVFRLARRPLEARRLGWLGDLLGLTAIVGFLLAHLRPELLLSATTATGGDMASHVLTFEVLRNELLPNGRLLGWMPGNLAGYPIFQLYFPLPFLAMLAWVPWVGAAAAFKIGTVLGSIALPPAAYLLMRLLRFERPVPLLAAAATLPFLFIEANSVWGGNLPSTLAGEFAYSLAMAITVVFLGTVHRGLATGRLRALNAILLAAIGLSHAYALLVAGTASACSLLWSADRRRALGYLAWVWGVAFCLIGFWIVPLLAYNGFTSPYRDVWAIDSWQVALPSILWPLALLALLGAADFVRRQRHRLSPPSGLMPLLALGAVALAYYRVAPRLGVVDIRFLPFAQLTLVLLAAVPLGRWLGRRRTGAALVPLVLLSVFAWIDARVTYLPQWIDWNYSGFESRPLWPAFAEVNRALQGDADDARVVYEHSPAHNAAGSIRAFESLPLFSGRSTLEGLYIQSGLLTPEIFYLQSELSRVASCPLPEFHCARPDIERAADHLRLFNVGRVVARSDELSAALAASDRYELIERVPPFAIYAVAGPAPSYVVPLSHRPVPVAGDDWRQSFFHWFKRAAPGDPVLVRADASIGGPPYAYDDVVAGFLPRSPIDGASVNATAVLGNDEIVLRTDRPGHPLLVKVAYHPRWRADDGSRVAAASPGFLLVYPQGREVRLAFSAPPVVRAGHGLTVLGVLLLPLLARVGRGSAGLAEPRPAHLAALVLLVIAAGAAGAGRFAPELFDRGMEAYKAERFDQADELFEQAIDAAPISSSALHATFYRGLVAYRESRWQTASLRFEEMIDRFPESPYRAEAAYHVALCRQQLGDTAIARATLARLIDAFPDSPWAGYAEERLEAWS